MTDESAHSDEQSGDWLATAADVAETALTGVPAPIRCSGPKPPI